MTNNTMRARELVLWTVAAVMMLAGCQDEPVRPTPPATFPPLEASPTFTLLRPTEIPPDAVLPQLPGINNPTAAALPGEADVLPDTSFDGVYKPQVMAIPLTESGVSLNAELYANPEGARGVLMLAAPFDDWGGLPATLREQGYTVLAVDGRVPTQAGDFAAAFNALVTLGRVSQAGIAVIGAETFADAALIGCAEESRCATVVMLSPRDPQATVSALAGYGDRPLLAASSLNDADGTRTIEALRASASGDALIQPLDDGGTGTQMIQRRADLVTLIETWLARYTR